MRSRLTIVAVTVTSLAGCTRSMGDAEYRALLTRAHEELTAKQARLDSVYRLGSYERYDYDQTTGEIVFSDHGVPKIVADIQFVGSTSTISDTWLWAWDNPTVEPAMKAEVRRVRDFGREHGIRRLTNAKWAADEVDGWEMTSISAQVLQAEGAYRAPHENGATFLLFKNVRWADPSQRADPGARPGANP